MIRRANLTRAEWAKFAVILLFTACWSVSNVVRSRFAGGETDLDASWLMGLSASLQQGLISGRDFHFTYGPAAQVFAWVGTFLTVTKSAFDAYRMSCLIFVLLSGLSIAVAFLVYDRISGKQTAVVYVCLLILNVFRDIASLRMALLVLCAAFTYRVITAREPKPLLHGIALGAFCFFCQLVTPEICIYGATVVTGSLLISYFREKRSATLKSVLAFLATLIFLNIGTDIVFKMTSTNYTRLFDYQWYGFEMIRGYNNAMGLNWDMNATTSLMLVSVALYTIVVATVVIRKGDRADRYLVGTLLLASLVALKGALIRSEIGHVSYAAAPLVFTFLLLARRDWNSKIGQSVWFALFVGLIWVLPNAGMTTPREVGKVLNGEYRLGPMLHNMANVSFPPGSVLQAPLLSPELRSGGPLLAFPYENYIPIVLKRPLLAPVLQSYIALTPSLQRFYVDAIERHRPQGAQIVYGVDNLGVWPVDGVPAVTRVPLIFDYLYRNFEIKSTTEDHTGHFILEDRKHERQVTLKDLPYRTERWSNSSGIARLAEPATCGLLLVELTVTSSWRTLFFRPSGIELTFRRGGTPVSSLRVRPSEFGHTFTTYASLVKPAQFHNLFREGMVPAPSWDSVDYTRLPADKLSARPTRVELHRLQCVNPQAFVEADPALDILDSEDLIPAELSRLPIRTGYAVFRTGADMGANVTARVLRAGVAGMHRDIVVRSPAAQYEIRLPEVPINDVGLAIVNPHKQQIAIDLSYESNGKHQKSRLLIGSHQQVSKLLGELFPADDVGLATGTLAVSSKESFSLFAARFLGQQFEILPSSISMVDTNSPPVFPQFVWGGGWATVLIVSNPAEMPIEGHIDFFSPDALPMAVTINGSTSKTFNYSVAPGRTYVLRPDAGSRSQ
jgi:hypothetical protein